MDCATDEKLQDPLKKCIIMKDGLFTLHRKTRAGVANNNGAIYTKEAFDTAMTEYIKNNRGSVFLAPVTIEKGFDIQTIRKINTDIYRKFHEPLPKLEYKIGEVTSWDDFAITTKYIPTSTTKELVNNILDKSKICVRYIAEAKRGVPIEKMRIICLDIACIPLSVLNVDLSEYC